MASKPLPPPQLHLHLHLSHLPDVQVLSLRLFALTCPLHGLCTGCSSHSECSPLRHMLPSASWSLWGEQSRTPNTQLSPVYCSEFGSLAGPPPRGAQWPWGPSLQGRGLPLLCSLMSPDTSVSSQQSFVKWLSDRLDESMGPDNSGTSQRLYLRPHSCLRSLFHQDWKPFQENGMGETRSDPGFLRPPSHSPRTWLSHPPSPGTPQGCCVLF